MAPPWPGRRRAGPVRQGLSVGDDIEGHAFRPQMFGDGGHADYLLEKASVAHRATDRSSRRCVGSQVRPITREGRSLLSALYAPSEAKVRPLRCPDRGRWEGGTPASFILSGVRSSGGSLALWLVLPGWLPNASAVRCRSGLSVLPGSLPVVPFGDPAMVANLSLNRAGSSSSHCPDDRDGLSDFMDRHRAQRGRAGPAEAPRYPGTFPHFFGQLRISCAILPSVVCPARIPRSEALYPKRPDCPDPH